jgi:hypothetical protein
MRDLSLQEQMLLLCLNDETGKYDSRYVGCGLAGAALIELIRSGRAVLNGDQVAPGDCTATGDDLLDLGVARLKLDPRAHHIKEWIRFLARPTQTSLEILTARLVLAGILTEREGRILWIFRTVRYPTDDPVPEGDLRAEIRRAVLETADVSRNTAGLVALLNGTRTLSLVCSRDELRSQAARVEKVAAEVSRAIAMIIADDEASAATVAAMSATSSSS